VNKLNRGASIRGDLHPAKPELSRLERNQRQQQLTTCRPKVGLVNRLEKVLRIAETHNLQSQDGHGQLV
jgi:hypothetical protein